MVESFLSEKQIYPFIDLKVKPILTDDNSHIFYTYNNFLFGYNIKDHTTVLRQKISKNRISQIEFYNNNIYILTETTDIQNSEFVLFNLNTYTITKTYQFSLLNKQEIIHFNLDNNNKNAFFLTPLKLIQFSIESFEVLNEFNIDKTLGNVNRTMNFNDMNDNNKVEKVTKPLNFVILNINSTFSNTKTSNIFVINFKLFLLVIDLYTGNELVIKDSSLNRINNITQITSEVYSNNSYSEEVSSLNNNTKTKNIEEFKIAVSDKYGKIHIIQNFLEKASSNNLVEDSITVGKFYTVSSFHWHSSSVVLSSNSNTVFSGAEEGVVVGWNKNTFNKTFFPRISKIIYQITANESAFLVVSNDQIMVYNYLEYKVLAAINFVDCSENTIFVDNCLANSNNKNTLLDTVYQKGNWNNFNNKNSDNYLVFFNKLTGVVYFIHPYDKITRRSELSLNSNSVNANYKNDSLNNTYYKRLLDLNKEKEKTTSIISNTKLVYKHIAVSSFTTNPTESKIKNKINKDDDEKNINKKIYNYVATVEEIVIAGNKISTLKIYLINSDMKATTNVKMTCMTIAYNPHGNDEIDSLQFFNESNPTSKEQKLILTSVSNKGEFIFWRNINNLGFVNDYSYKVPSKSLYSKLPENHNSKINYCIYHKSIYNYTYVIIVQDNKHLIKLNISTYEIENKLYLNSLETMTNKYYNCNIKLLVDMKQEYLIVSYEYGLICVELENLKYLWEEKLNNKDIILKESSNNETIKKDLSKEPSVKIIDIKFNSKIDYKSNINDFNSLNILLSESDNDKKDKESITSNHSNLYLYSLLVGEHKRFLDFIAFKIMNATVAYLVNKDTLYVQRRKFLNNFVYSFYKINSNKKYLYSEVEVNSKKLKSVVEGNESKLSINEEDSDNEAGLDDFKINKKVINEMNVLNGDKKVNNRKKSLDIEDNAGLVSNNFSLLRNKVAINNEKNVLNKNEKSSTYNIIDNKLKGLKLKK